MASSKKDKFASKVPKFNDKQKWFIAFVHMDLSDTELTPAQILKQLRIEYEPVGFFSNELKHHPRSMRGSYSFLAPVKCQSKHMIRTILLTTTLYVGE